jgi:hypothetical protein
VCWHPGVTDQPTLDGIKLLIERMQAKAALHRSIRKIVQLRERMAVEVRRLREQAAREGDREQREILLMRARHIEAANQADEWLAPFRSEQDSDER